MKICRLIIVRGGKACLLPLFFIFLFTIPISCDVEDYLDQEVMPSNAEFGKPRNLDDISNILFGTYWQMMIGRGESGFRQPITIFYQWNSTASDAFTITDQETFTYQNQGDGYFVYNRIQDVFQDNTITRIYEHAYNLISNLNEAIELIENPTQELLSQQVSDTELYNQLVGEVYGLRAYNYFMLTQVYGPKFTPGAENDVPSIILKTRNSAEFDEIFSSRSTLIEAYNLMIDDLLIASEHIPSTKLVGRLNKGAIYGFLARVYLDMNEWEKVREYSDLAINGGFNLEARPIDAFNHTDNSFSREVIFEMQNSIGHQWTGRDDRQGNNSAIRMSYWNWIERRTMGAATFNGKNFTVDNIGMRTYAVSHSIMREIGWMEQTSTNLTAAAQNDLRFQQLYHWAPGGTDSRMEVVVNQVPQENFMWVFKDARSVNDNTLDGNNFTYEDYDGRSHLPIIRLSEMILTRAIAAYKLGDQGSALDDLNLVKQRSWDNAAGPFVPFSGSGMALEMEIKHERAKELLGEGDRLFYLKAMQYDVPVGDSERRPDVAVPIVSFPYDALFWELPPEETNANPNVD